VRDAAIIYAIDRGGRVGLEGQDETGALSPEPGHLMREASSEMTEVQARPRSRMHLDADVVAEGESAEMRRRDCSRLQIEEFRRQIIAGEIVVPSTPAEKAGA
jgi:hypothetical protein